jgi:hypothetical protein
MRRLLALALCCCACARAAGVGAPDGGRGPAQPSADSPEAYAARARALWRGGAHGPCVPRPPLGASAEAALERASARYAMDDRKGALLVAERKAHARLERDSFGGGWWQNTSSPLNQSTCSRMFADARHPVHSMFGVAWRKMDPTCLPQTRAGGEGWVRAMEKGDMCARNWFQDTSNCSSASLVPNFQVPAAPALFGTDLGIDTRCRWWLRGRETHRPGRPPRGQGKQNCILAGYNVMALFGSAPRYNMCRNLEWVVCAARGHLHLQHEIVFNPQPKSVTMSVFHPTEPGASPSRYPSRVVFVFELCALSLICTNGEQLFEIGKLQPFVCQFREGALIELVHHIEAGRVWRVDDSGASVS